MPCPSREAHAREPAREKSKRAGKRALTNLPDAFTLAPDSNDQRVGMGSLSFALMCWFALTMPFVIESIFMLVVVVAVMIMVVVVMAVLVRHSCVAVTDPAVIIPRPG